MAFRNNNRNNRFDRGNFGGSGGRNVNPWGDNQGGRGGNMNQNSQGGHIRSDTLSLANNLITNLLRNQGGSSVPPLMDMPPSFGRGYGNGPNRGYDDFNRFDGRGIGNRNSGPINRNNRRQGQGGANRPNQKGGIRKAKDRAKNVLPKNANASDSADSKVEKSETGKENGTSRKQKRRDSPYANIPNDMFYCHMCKKHMWDSTSFENHIKGRSHQMMREGIEESYRLRANMIRQEAKIMEQLKSIEIDRMKRLGKNLKGGNQHREYCTMCDLHFYGRLSAHRKTDGHLNLKKFLHPKCIDCNKEFTNRTEFDEHLLSPTHMTKAAGKANRNDKKKNKLNILTEADELPGLKEEKEEKDEKEEKKDETTEPAVDENGEPIEKVEAVEAVEGVEGVEGEEKPAEGVEGEEPVAKVVVEESPDIILDFTEKTEIPIEIEDKIPKYNCNRQLGSSMISKLECYECRVCERFFDNEITAEIHSRTVYHHRQYVKMLNEKSNETKIAQKRAAAAAEEDERRKRIKLEDEAEAEAEAEAAKKAEEGVVEGELYDPSEATIDEEDTSVVVKEESVENIAEESFASTTEEVQDTTVVEEEQPDVAMEEAPETPVVETPATPVATPVSTPSTPVTPVTPATKQTAQRGGQNKSGGGRGGRGRGRGRYGGKY